MDYYLKAATEADMTEALLVAGLIDEDGNPTPGVSIDTIGPITRVTGYDENGDPITVEYPEWHVNLRCAGLTEEQEAELAFAIITPPSVPYRVWA